MSTSKLLQRNLINQTKYESLNAFVLSSLPKNSIVQNAGSVAGKRQSEPRDKTHDRLSDEQLSIDIRGKFIAIKDNICSTGQETTCCSGILEGFKSPYPATVVKRLQNAGAIIGGRTNMDEFGMGSHSDTSVYGTTQNPIVGDHGHSTSAGGSSGGSAVAVATGQCYAALGTDTGGSIRLPAAYTGVVGFKPSYGLVSRFGIIAYSNSLDTVGVLARNSVAARGIFKIIEGYDENDPTSLSETSRSKLASQILRRKYKKSLRIGVPVEYNIQELDKSIRNAWLVALRYLRQEGHSICSVSLPTTQSALSAYYVLAPAEASSNLAKYDNARYGNQESIESTHKTGEKLYSSVRGARLGTEVQRRILLGAHSLSADARENYFIQAQKVRRMVQQDFDELFALPHPLRDNTNLEQDHGVDVLVTPTAPTLPPALSSLSNRSPLESYADDVLTVAASLAGLPAISIPYPVTFGEPIQRWRSNGEEERLTKHQDCTGLQITAQYGDDENVFRVAEMLSGTTVERRE